MVHKFYAIKSEKAIKTGTIVSTFFAIIVSGGCYFLGGFGRLFDSPAIYKADGSIVYDAIVPSMLATLPDILIGIVIVLVLSASMSTLSSLVLTSASTLTLDFIKGTIDLYPRVNRVLYRDFRCACAQSPDVYRTAYGHFMGCSCRCVPCTVPLWSVLERRDKGRRLGKLYLRCGHYGFQYVL